MSMFTKTGVGNVWFLIPHFVVVLNGVLEFAPIFEQNAGWPPLTVVLCQDFVPFFVYTL